MRREHDVLVAQRRIAARQHAGDVVRRDGRASRPSPWPAPTSAARSAGSGLPVVGERDHLGERVARSGEQPLGAGRVEGDRDLLAGGVVERRDRPATSPAGRRASVERSQGGSIRPGCCSTMAPSAPACFSAAQRTAADCACALERVGHAGRAAEQVDDHLAAAGPGRRSRRSSARGSTGRSRRTTSGASTCGAGSMRIENAASVPSATGSTLPSRTSARLDCASTIVRDVNGTGCR